MNNNIKMYLDNLEKEIINKVMNDKFDENIYIDMFWKATLLKVFDDYKSIFTHNFIREYHIELNERYKVDDMSTLFESELLTLDDFVEITDTLVNFTYHSVYIRDIIIDTLYHKIKDKKEGSNNE